MKTEINAVHWLGKFFYERGVISPQCLRPTKLLRAVLCEYRGAVNCGNSSWMTACTVIRKTAWWAFSNSNFSECGRKKNYYVRQNGDAFNDCGRTNDCLRISSPCRPDIHSYPIFFRSAQAAGYYSSYRSDPAAVPMRCAVN